MVTITKEGDVWAPRYKFRPYCPILKRNNGISPILLSSEGRFLRYLRSSLLYWLCINSFFSLGSKREKDEASTTTSHEYKHNRGATQQRRDSKRYKTFFVFSQCSFHSCLCFFVYTLDHNSYRSCLDLYLVDSNKLHYDNFGIAMKHEHVDKYVLFPTPLYVIFMLFMSDINILSAWTFLCDLCVMWTTFPDSRNFCRGDCGALCLSFFCIVIYFSLQLIRIYSTSRQFRWYLCR